MQRLQRKMCFYKFSGCEEVEDMKYLEDMSDEELLMAAKRERILLKLKFLRKDVIDNLEKKGYTRKDPVKAAEERELMEKERSRPKKSEIKILDDGSVEVVEVPMEDHEIEELQQTEEKIENIPEVLRQQEVVKNISMIGPRTERRLKLVQDPVKEENMNVENEIEPEKFSEEVLEKSLNDMTEIMSAEDETKNKNFDFINSVSLGSSEKNSDFPIDVVEKEIETNVEAVADDVRLQEDKKNIKIVIVAQNGKKADKRKSSRKYGKNFISRKSSKTLRKKESCPKNKEEQLSLFPERLSEDVIKRRIRERNIQNFKYTNMLGKELKDKDLHDNFFDKDPLPNAYFVDEVFLLPKNDKTLFAYWEIKEDTYNELQKMGKISSDVVIKVYKNGIEERKIHRVERIGSHYIHEIEADQDYEVSIGYEDEKGEYVEVAHSLKALSPRVSVSEEKDVKWMKVDEDYQKEEVKESEHEGEKDVYIDDTIFSVLLNKVKKVSSS